MANGPTWGRDLAAGLQQAAMFAFQQKLQEQNEAARVAAAQVGYDYDKYEAIRSDIAARRD